VVVEEIAMVSDPEREAATAEAVKKALSNFNTSQANIVFTVSNQKTVIDYVPLPIMPESELAEAVKFEVSSSSHFPVENPIVDFKVVGRVDDKGIEKLNVMVAAVAQSSVDQILDNFKPLAQDPLAAVKKLLLVEDHMGLNLSRVIPISVALENVIKNSNERSKGTIATLEIGSMAAEFNVYREGELEFSRKINVTGLDFTRCLTTALFGSTGKVELTFDEAERVKKEFGIPKASEDFLIKDKITANQAISLLRPKLEQLIKEITRSFDFYYDKNRVGTIDHLVLYGGGAMLKRLPEFLNAELGLPVSMGNPLQSSEALFEGVVSIELEQRATLAIGASLSDLKGINLLPEKSRNSNKKFAQRIMRVAAALVFVLCSFAFYIFLAIHLSGVNQETAKIKDSYVDMLPKLKGMKEKLLIQSLAAHRFNFPGLLRELSYLPEQVYLKNINYSNGELMISGIVKGSAREAKKILAPIVADLKKTAFKEVKLQPITENATKELSNFMIKAKSESAATPAAGSAS